MTKESTISGKPGLTVRDARPGELEILQDVTVSAYEEYAAYLPAPHWELYRQDIVNTLSKANLNGQIVAEKDSTILGTVLLYPAGTVFTAPGDTTIALKWPEARLLAVVPGARGQGIGRALMQECIKRARDSGSQGLTLHTTDMMQTAMRLYERMGFTRLPELDFNPAPDVIIKGYQLNLDERIPG